MYQIVIKTEATAARSSAMETRDHSKNGAIPKSQMSRGNFFKKTCFAVFSVLAGVLLMAAFSGCGGGGGGGKSAKIKMTTEADGKVSVALKGSGVATVYWGDGSEKVTLTLNEDGWVEFEHTYPSATIRTITVNGDNITGLYCRNSKLTSLDVSKNTALTTLVCAGNQLTSLDVSKNTALTTLNCEGNQLTSLDVSKNTALTVLWCGGNQLTSLDVSKNTALTELRCEVNQLTAAALNALFGTLHSNPTTPKNIYRYSNPGAADCDRSIAERKGWKVDR